MNWSSTFEEDTTVTKKLDDFADERERARFAENQELSRSNRALRSLLQERDNELERLRKQVDLVDTLQASRLEPPDWLTPSGVRGKHVGLPKMLLTDLHWGEVVSPDQIGYINAYNVTIAERRVRRAFENAIIVPRDYYKGVTYEGFGLLLGGDNVSGTIHDELKETNQGQLTEHILSVVECLEAGIHLLVKEFKKVYVAGVVGNHGRSTKKPRAKFRAQDNWDWFIYKLLERDFRGVKGVTIDVPNSADHLVSFYRTRYLLTHGDQFRGGSGISSLLAPLMLGSHRKTRREAAAGRGYDVMVMGHWHQTLMFPSKGIVVGGSIKGYDELAYTLNLEPEPPQQAFWITTPEHGPTFPASIFVQDRKEEGW